MRDEVDFFHADKHESLLKIVTNYDFNGHGKAFLKFSKQQVSNIFTIQYLEKEVRDEVDFLHAGKHESFLQFDFKVSKFPTITAQKMKFSIEDFFSKCDQIRSHIY